MNDSFNVDSATTHSELFRVAGVNLGQIADDRCQNLKTSFAQIPEQSEFTYRVYLVAAGHLEPDVLVPDLATVFFSQELRTHADPSIVVMLVGNKCDLKHLQAVLTGERYALYIYIHTYICIYAYTYS